MTPYLPTPSRLGILQSEAGNRAQTDNCYGLTLALTGSTHGETEPIKATYVEAGRNTKNPDLARDNPADVLDDKRQELGILAVEVVPPKGTNNLDWGTNKNELRVLRRSNLK